MNGMRHKLIWKIGVLVVVVCSCIVVVIRGSIIGGGIELGEAIEAGNAAKVKTLLAEGVSPNCHDDNRATPLHVAALNGEGEIAEILITAGAKINAKDQYDYTPLMVVREKPGKLNPTRVLLQHGADITQTVPKGLNALWYAMLGKRRESTELLLDHGADPNYAVKHITPLISAVIEHDLPLVRLLLAHGAKVNTKMPNGNTALRLARREHDSDIERLLLKAGAKE